MSATNQSGRGINPNNKCNSELDWFMREAIDLFLRAVYYAIVLIYITWFYS